MFSFGENVLEYDAQNRSSLTMDAYNDGMGGYASPSFTSYSESDPVAVGNLQVLGELEAQTFMSKVKMWLGAGLMWSKANWWILLLAVITLYTVFKSDKKGSKGFKR